MIANKKGWMVLLTKKPVLDTYRSGYFPRQFYYKKDAEAGVQEVRKLGGDAKIVSAKLWHEQAQTADSPT